jgi:hypothetical protein
VEESAVTTEPTEPTGVPDIEPDASLHVITGPPTPTEYGTHTFARQIAAGLQTLLGGTISRLAVRENRWDRRPCAHAWAYELTLTDRHRVAHAVRIIAYEATRPLGATRTEYALTLDDQPVDFDQEGYQGVPWQLARAVWIAAMDRRVAADRAARAAAQEQTRP